MGRTYRKEKSLKSEGRSNKKRAFQQERRNDVEQMPASKQARNRRYRDYDDGYSL